MVTRRPNIVLILVDDMGFSDLGCTGAEIRTPNIDAIARDGVLLSAMYNCARCCPTRASLLTGLYPHNAGIGHMGVGMGTAAYQGYLRNDSVTLAEVLRDAGYRTCMAGKWHVGGDFIARNADNWRVGDVEHPTPRQRGFDHFYGTLDGATHFFSPHYVMKDDRRVEVPPSDFYFTDAITDEAIAMIEGASSDDATFFLYLAHAAPHWPLHAHEEDIARYDGVYRCGWDAIRTARHEQMQSLGVLQRPFKISPRDEKAPSWVEAKYSDWEAQRMAVYAAMIDRMDQSVGRVLSALQRLGQYEDTLVLFLSDNGGSAEFMAEDGWAQFMPNVHNDGRRIEMGNKPTIRPGGPLTYMSYDLPWANVSNAPFRRFKHWVHEGGISTPLIAQWPARLGGGATIHSPVHVADVMPTILEASGAAYPAEFGGHEIQAMDGESFLPLLEGQDWRRQAPIFWEHEGHAAVRDGDFKLVRRFGHDWELYDMENDRTELRDLSDRNAPMRKRLAKAYGLWADSVGVLDWQTAFPIVQAAWGMRGESG